MGERKSSSRVFLFDLLLFWLFFEDQRTKSRMGGSEFKECESGLQEGGAKVSETQSTRLFP
jgi:hypothetical protein